jgi:hypothetical protein
VKSETQSWFGLLGPELPIHLVQRTRRLPVADRGSNDLAADHPAQPVAAHQPLDGAAGHRMALAVQLPPDLVGAVDLQVGSPDALDVRHQASSRRARWLRNAGVRCLAAWRR